MIREILPVERLPHPVLSDDIQIPPIKVGVTLHAGRLRAFAQNHVGRHETTGVCSSQHHTPAREVLQHIMPEIPTEPPSALAASIVVKKQRP